MVLGQDPKNSYDEYLELQTSLQRLYVPFERLFYLLAHLEPQSAAGADTRVLRLAVSTGSVDYPFLKTFARNEPGTSSRSQKTQTEINACKPMITQDCPIEHIGPCLVMFKVLTNIEHCGSSRTSSHHTAQQTPTTSCARTWSRFAPYIANHELAPCD